jgi:hypothetical protein
VSVRARILIAGMVVLLMAAGVCVYLQWPRWYGTEILLPATVRINSGNDGYVSVDYPDAKVKIDALPVMENAAPGKGGYVPIRTVGVVRDSRIDPDQQVAQIRNRAFFLQLKPTDAHASDGRAMWHPVSISDTPIRDAVNLRVRVLRAERNGELDLEIASDRLRLSSPPSGDQVAVILKVLPSGRHAVVDSLTR